MALVILMTIVRSVIVVITLVASMIVMVVTTAMLMIAQFTAMCGGKRSRFLFLWLLLTLGNLIKNASRLVSCLTLLEEGNHSERVKRHRLVQVGKLVLVCLRLCEEDLFTLCLHPSFDGGSHS